MHRQQVGVASNDHVGPAIQRDFQELVVFGVAAFPDLLKNGNKFGDLSESHQESFSIIVADVAIKFLAGKNVGQLIHGRLRKQKQRVELDLPQNLGGNRLRQNQPADQDVGVGHNPSESAH